MNFTEQKLENSFIELLQQQNFIYQKGEQINRENQEEVLIKEDLNAYLHQRYPSLTSQEVKSIVRDLEKLPASDLYDSNKAIMHKVANGFTFKREDRNKKDLYIQLIDYDNLSNNLFKAVNQLEIQGYENLRIPDVIVYINGLPLVVVELKSAVRENATIHDAYVQITTRYRRDIPALFKYNAFCVISDGVNNKAGSFFAPYEFFYAWRRTNGSAKEVDGIASLYTLLEGMFAQNRLVDIIHHFIYMPDTPKKEEKIVCRYPQYYAVRALFENIKKHQKPEGDGKGGTYFGATGCGKSFTMLFLTRMLMKSPHFASPTIVLITDRTDLDDQLTKQFVNAKEYIGDNYVKSVESRSQLREYLQGRNSGGVFLTTIHKFSEDAQLLTERTNVICISDEAHRSQTNLDQKLTITEKGVRKSFGFAKHLHDSLPNATYVGFTGTPIDATLDVFGEVVDAYTMTESVEDEITVRIVYEGRAAKVVMENSKLRDIEDYYEGALREGSNEYQIDESKRQSSHMNTILGDANRLQAIAEDFVQHYEQRIEEGATVRGKAMFVCSSREIAFDFYKRVIALRPQWAEILNCAEGESLAEKEKKENLPLERVKMVMTRGKDDPEALYHALGNKQYRAKLDKAFKNPKSNFKIAIVVDMWLTGFDVPFLDTIYIDKPIQKHNLIQTISRVNRKFEGKDKGLVVDYIGIKKNMNQALAMFIKVEGQNFEDIQQSISAVRDHLDLLRKMFHKFDASLYFTGTEIEQLKTLNYAVEFIQQIKAIENRFMELVKRLKSAYDICAGSEEVTEEEKEQIHFYIAIRSILFKLTKGEAPDTAQMNKKVKEMVAEAIKSDGVEEIIALGENQEGKIDIFDEDYLAKINKIKLPNTKIKLLQKLLARAIEDFKKVNKIKGVDFSKKMQSLVERYNERKEDDVLVGEVLDDFADEITSLIYGLKSEMSSFEAMGIDFEEKAFYDILLALAHKYDFNYPEDQTKALAQKVKLVVDDKANYTDWNTRDDIKAELKVALILLLHEFKYPPVDRDEVYKEIFEQAENFKKYN